MSAGDIRAGRAYVELLLKDSAFTKGLRNAQGMLSDFGSGLSAIGFSMLKLGSAIVAPLTAAVMHFVKTGDAIGDMAARTGIATSALAELGYAAGQSDVTLETLEKTLQRMAITIDRLRKGGKEAVDLFRDLGLTAADLVGLAPDKQLDLIADRLKNVHDATKRMTIAQGIFGKAGASLVPMLRNLARLRAEGRREGLLPSDQAIQAAGAIDDAITKIRATISAAVFEVGHVFAPAVLEASETIRTIVRAVKTWVEQNRELIQSVGRIGAALIIGGGAFIGMAKAIGFLHDAFNAIGQVAQITAFSLMLPVRAASALKFVLMPLGAGVDFVTHGLRRLSAIGGTALTAVQRTAVAALNALSPIPAQLGRIVAGVARVALGFAQMGDMAGTMLIRGLARGIIAAGPAVASGLQWLGAKFASDFSFIMNRAWQSIGPPARAAFLRVAIAAQPIIQTIAAAYQRIAPVAIAVGQRIVAGWQRVGPVIASRLTATIGGAFAAIRATGLATGRILASGVGNIGRGLAGSLAGVAGIFTVIGSAAGGLLGQIAAIVPQVLLLGSSLAMLMSPATIVIGAILAAGYAWTQFSAAGRAALGGLIEIIRPFATIASVAFAGVRDALALGDVAAAGEIAMAALKAAFFTAVEAMATRFKPLLDLLLGGWDIVKTLWDTTVAALTAAWTTAMDLVGGVFGDVVGDMGGTWGDFVEGLVSLFTQAARMIADIWQKTTSAISDYLLADAANGGFMGTAALLGTGIDVKTEQGRAELYKKQLDLTKKKELAGQREALAAAEAGDGTFTDEGGTWTVDQLKKRIAELEQEIGNDAAMPVDVLGDMQRDARDQLAASADGFRSSLDGIDARAQKRNREPGRGAVGDAAAGAAKQAQDELARLTAAATAAREAARAKAAEDREKVEEAQESNDPATMRGEVFGSYSAAALQARSGGGSLAERAAKAGERAADGIDDLARRFEALNGVEKEILDEIRLGGALA